MGDHKQTCGIFPALWWYGPNRKGVLVYRCDFDAPLFFISVTHRRITHLLDSEVGGGKSANQHRNGTLFRIFRACVQVHNACIIGFRYSSEC